MIRIPGGRRAGLRPGLRTRRNSPVQVEHQRHCRGVVHRYDAGHDRDGAERDQRAGRAEQLVALAQRDDTGVAAGQHQVARSTAQPLQVVDREGTVVEAQRGEQRAVSEKVPWAAMCTSRAPSIAVRTRATVAVPLPSTTGSAQAAQS